jgi:hypothetical protein
MALPSVRVSKRASSEHASPEYGAKHSAEHRASAEETRESTEESAEPTPEEESTEEASEEEDPADEESKVAANYQSLRSAIGHYCLGDKGALPAASVKCLEDAFFSPRGIARFFRRMRQQNVNICDLDEEDYERLMGQQNIRIEEDGTVGEPEVPGECSKMLPNARYSAMEAAVQLALASMALPASLAKHMRKPLDLLTLHFSNPVFNALANTVIRLGLAAFSHTAFCIMALNGLTLFLQLMPRYVSNEACMDRHGLHPVPARFRLCGHFLSALIFGPIAYTLMYLSNADAHAEVAKVLGASVTEISSKDNAIVQASLFASFFATLAGSEKLSAGIFITDMLYNVVFYFMRLLGDALKEPRVAQAVKVMIAAVVAVDHIHADDFKREPFFRMIHLAIDNINNTHQVDGDMAQSLSESLQTSIKAACDDTVALLVGTSEPLSWADAFITGAKAHAAGMGRMGAAAGGVTAALASLFQELKAADGPAAIATITENLHHVIPSSLVTDFFTSSLLQLTEGLGCRLARLLYSHRQRRKHLHF